MKSENKLANGTKVLVLVNDIIGKIPAIIVRDRTDDKSACCGLRLDGENVYEARYTQGPHRGQYTDVPHRNLEKI